MANIEEPKLPKKNKKKESPVKKSGPASEITSGKFFTRNKIVGVFALIAGAAGLYEVTETQHSIPEPATNSKSATTPKQKNPTAPSALSEKKETKEKVLGNIRFIFAPENKLSSQEQEQVLQTLQNAYKKLVGYFGEDVMTHHEAIDCPIIIDPSNQDVKGQVEWKTTTKFHPDGNFTIAKAHSVNLLLKSSKKEAVVAHELIHLFAQPQTVLSMAFKEGHAHAIIKNIYGEDNFVGTPIGVLANEAILKNLNIGLDYVMESSEDFPRGMESDTHFSHLALIKWQEEWQTYETKDENFFKKFYGKISKLKKQGKFNFTKKELLNIAEEASPGFLKWYKDNKVLHDLGEDGEQQILRAAKSSDRNVLILLNVKTEKQKDGDPQGGIAPVVKGRLGVIGKEGGKESVEMQSPKPLIPLHFINLKGLPPSVEILGVQIGDQKVLFEK